MKNTTLDTIRTFGENFQKHAFTIVAVAAFIIIYGLVGYVDTHGKLDAEVIAVEGEEIVLKVSETTYYAFYGDGFVVGDKVVAYVKDNGTATTVDDEILDVKKVDKR
jgi:hypothetical protein